MKFKRAACAPMVRLGYRTDQQAAGTGRRDWLMGIALLHHPLTNRAQFLLQV